MLVGILQYSGILSSPEKGFCQYGLIDSYFTPQLQFTTGLDFEALAVSDYGHSL